LGLGSIHIPNRSIKTLKSFSILFSDARSDRINYNRTNPGGTTWRA
jgi:hypothetical protein